MVDPLLLGAVTLLVVVAFMFADQQLRGRREKRHEKWQREQELAEKRIDEAFAEPESDADESGESDGEESSNADVPVTVEAEPGHVPMSDRMLTGDMSCVACGRSEKTVPKKAGSKIVPVCDRQSCKSEVDRKVREVA